MLACKNKTYVPNMNMLLATIDRRRSAFTATFESIFLHGSNGISLTF